jgi:hypothetical protein
MDEIKLNISIVDTVRKSDPCPQIGPLSDLRTRTSLLELYFLPVIFVTHSTRIACLG